MDGFPSLTRRSIRKGRDFPAQFELAQYDTSKNLWAQFVKIALNYGAQSAQGPKIVARVWIELLYNLSGFVETFCPFQKTYFTRS